MVHLSPKVVCALFSCILLFLQAWYEPLAGGGESALSQHTLSAARSLFLPLLLSLVLQVSLCCCFFFPLACVLFLLLSQDRIQLRSLLLGMGKSEKISNSGCRSPIKVCPVLKPRGVTHSNRSVQTLDDQPKIQNYAQGIVHYGVAKGHITVIDTGAQQYMVSIGGWEIIKLRDT